MAIIEKQNQALEMLATNFELEVLVKMGIETFIAKVIKVVNSFYGKDIDIIFLRKKRIVVRGLAIVKLESLKHKSYGFYHVIIFHIHQYKFPSRTSYKHCN